MAVEKPVLAAAGMEVLKEIEKRELDQLEREDRLNKVTNLQVGDVITGRQKKVITALSCEKKNLINNLKLIKSTRTQKVDNEQAVKITELFDEGDSLDELLNTKRQHLSDLNKQIAKTTSAIYQATRSVKYAEKSGGTLNSEKRISTLENKLYVANVKLNKTLKANESLKEDIELQMITRRAFNNMYKKMLKKLEDGKAIVSNALQKSEDTYNKREIIIKKLGGLKSRDMADLISRRTEMQDLQMRYEQDVKLRDFRQTVTQKRRMKETELRNRIKEEREREVNLKLEQNYTEIYNKITEFTETEDMDVVKREFVKGEALNMMLLNYANDTNCELEVLSSEIEKQMNSYIDLKMTSEDRRFHQVQTRLRLETNFKDLQEFRKSLEIVVESHDKEMSTLFMGIGDLFVECESDTWPIELILGDNKQVTKFNFMLYCKLIEFRLIELLTTYDLPKVELDLLSPTAEPEELKFKKDSKYAIPTKVYASDTCDKCLASLGKSKILLIENKKRA